MDNKQIISKKSLIKEFKISFRIFFGSTFILVAGVFVFIDLYKYFTSDIICTVNTIGNVSVALFILLVFGIFIGLKQILKAISIVKTINSPDFKVEIDEVIDKYDVNNDNNTCSVILKYNKTIVPRSKWNKIKVGSKYYVFNISDKENIIKSVKRHKLDENLQKQLIDYHVNLENGVEKWEKSE